MHFDLGSWEVNKRKNWSFTVIQIEELFYTCNSFEFINRGREKFIIIKNLFESYEESIKRSK